MISPSYLSPEEYLEAERNAPTKSEYFNGKIFAMAGASPNHNFITANVVISLGIQLRGKPCRVFASDLRIRIPDTGLFTYPDAGIVCGEPRYADDRADTLLNPMAIIEVLSSSTEAYDRGDKFAHYRTLDSLTDYILIAQHRKRIEHFALQPDNRWLYTAITESEEAIALAGIGCALSIVDVYDKIEFVKASEEAE